MPDKAITIGEYEAAVQGTMAQETARKPISLQFGLAGEIGQLLSELKKDVRRDVRNHEEVLQEELGDCLWYLMAICIATKTSLHKVLNEKATTSINILQRNEVSKTDRNKLASSLLATNGALMKAFNDDDDVDEILQKLAFTLGDFTTSLKLPFCMEDIACANMEKTKGLFGKDFPNLKILDKDSPDFEQFPRKLETEIRQEKVGDDHKAMLFIGRFRYGNALDDNISGEPDYYRYHDVFHMAFVAHLGWSPSLRALLNMKRRSNQKTDNNEDGGRVLLMEEGLTHYIFRYGKKHNFFEGVKCPRVSIAVLKTIRDMVEGYEVADRPLALWNDAILNAFEVFLELREHHNGKITIDMDNRQLIFENLPKNQRP